jgi:mitochondrial fission protein ELM1
MKRFRILVLHDGKPGHLSQSLGLARMIASRCIRCECEIVIVKAVPRIKLLNRLSRRLVMSSSPYVRYLVFSLYRIEARAIEMIDLVVSFGGNVVALNIAFSKQFGIPNALIGDSYSIPEHAIRAHLSLNGELGGGNAIATSVVLCRVDQARCLRAGQALQDQGRPLWTLLVGGDGSGYDYHDADWHRLGAGIRALSEQYGIQWLISSSRRTGAAATKILQRYMDDDVCRAAIWYEDGHSEPLDAFLGAASRIFCSEDSLSMVSEAVAMDKPVITLRPTEALPSHTHGNAINYMANIKLLERIDINAMAQYRPHFAEPEKSYSAHLDDIFYRIVALGAVTEMLPQPGDRLANQSAAIPI